MPFKDPAARAAYMKRYWERYLPRPDAEAGTKSAAARRRKAAWYQANKARLTTKKRRQRRSAATAERLGVAAAILTTPTDS